MKWMFVGILLALGIPNLYKCLAVLGNFLSFLPSYLHEVYTNPNLLDNEESRVKFKMLLRQFFIQYKATG